MNTKTGINIRPNFPLEFVKVSGLVLRLIFGTAFTTPDVIETQNKRKGYDNE